MAYDEKQAKAAGMRHRAKQKWDYAVRLRRQADALMSQHDKLHAEALDLENRAQELDPINYF